MFVFNVLNTSDRLSPPPPNVEKKYVYTIQLNAKLTCMVGKKYKSKEISPPCCCPDPKHSGPSPELWGNCDLDWKLIRCYS